MAPDDKKKRSKRDQEYRNKNEEKKKDQAQEAVPLSTASPPLASSPPPPPYSATKPQLPTYPPQVPANRTSPTAWTRCLICQTDSSYIWLNADGSQIGYFKANGPAVASPTRASVARRYFCSDGSSITLSAEGWIHYNDGKNFNWVWNATQLGWCSYFDRPGFYAHAPPRPPPPPTTTNLPPVKRPGRKRRDKDDDSASEADDDGYNDMFKFGYENGRKLK